jgi:fructokinase
MAPVLCLGETLIDLIASDGVTRLEEASAFVARTGGAPANAAVALARLGVPSAFCGVVGADPFGRRLRETLAGYGVDVSRLRSEPGTETTIAFAWKDERGDGHFQLVRLADRLLSETDVEAAGIDRVEAIIVGSVALSAEPSRAGVTRAVELANAAKVPVCFDVNLRPSLWPSRESAAAACEPIINGATLLKLSLDDGRALYPDVDGPETLLRELERFPARFVAITDGERGAWFINRMTGGELEFVRSFKVAAVEPTGAGDAFGAAIVSRLIDRDWDGLSREDVLFASAAGALATTKPGAMEALPTRAEIEAFLARQTS